MDVSPGNVGTLNAYRRLSYVDYDAVGPEGDFGRRVLLNPAIFRLLGEVRGRSILDAGCGHGYLSRLFADRGATLVGVGVGRRAISVRHRREAGATPGGPVPAA